MYIFGFKIKEGDSWGEDPFEQGHVPENDICEVCHIYRDRNGNKYIGIELILNMDMEEMREILSPHSDELEIIKVIR